MSAYRRLAGYAHRSAAEAIVSGHLVAAADCLSEECLL